MKASKGNKVYTITETEKKHYIDSGFDIMDDDGGIIAYGRGKTVTYEEYVKLKEELEEVKEGAGETDAEVIEILTTYALEHGVDIGKATTITGILKKIKETKLEGGE